MKINNNNKKLLGVCSGIANSFNVDPIITRIIFLISMFLSFGTASLVYLILWILMEK
jgi:phage shock protein PspC (stress-responsive transcriptional regulator)